MHCKSLASMMSLRLLISFGFVLFTSITSVYALPLRAKGSCENLFAGNQFETLMERWGEFGHRRSDLEALLRLVTEGRIGLAEATAIVQKGNANRLGPDAYIEEAGKLTFDEAMRIYDAFQAPEVPQPIGRRERFSLPQAAARRLVPESALVTVQEYREIESLDGSLYIAVLINSRPIAMITFVPNGYRQMDIRAFETSKHVRGLGVEGALLKELLRRYPNTTGLSIRLPRSPSSLDSPQALSYGGIQEIMSNLGYYNLKLVKREIGADTVTVSLRRDR